jgi:hypothetical protein
MIIAEQKDKLQVQTFLLREEEDHQINQQKDHKFIQNQEHK